MAEMEGFEPPRDTFRLQTLSGTASRFLSNAQSWAKLLRRLRAKEVAGSIPVSGSTVGWWQDQQGERGVDPAGARARIV